MAKKKTKTREPPPPRTHREFGRRFPKLGKAWELIGIAGREGPLDDKTARLVKLGVAMGAMREGAVHSHVRQALAEGISEKEIEQVVALAAGALGMSSTAAVFTWVRDVTKGRKK
jgi:alkylhydroperoxidase/carboxymuconolactone decarboxylase family protein YurZ